MRCKVLVSDIASFTYPFVHYGLNPSDFNVRFVNPNDAKSIAQEIDNSLKYEKNIDFDFSYFSLENMVSDYLKIYKKLS
jgi:hypothetical protein